MKRSDNIFSEENDPCQENMDDKVLLMENASPEKLSRHLLMAAETCARMTANEIGGMQSETIGDAKTQNEDLNGAQLHQMALTADMMRPGDAHGSPTATTIARP